MANKEKPSSGGTANWSGLNFEARLAVEYCVYLLLGNEAGLDAGAVERVQLQAPREPDDLVVRFESGATWAFQAKSGDVGLSWTPGKPFADALLQLHGARETSDFNLEPGSHDRLILAVNHQAPRTVDAFGAWLAKAREHVSWDGLAAASTNVREREFVSKVSALLNADINDPSFLHFLQRVFVRRCVNLDDWWTELRSRLIKGPVPDTEAAERVLDVVMAQVVAAGQHRGEFNVDRVVQACADAGIPGIEAPRSRIPASFAVVSAATDSEMRRHINLSAIQLKRFVARPELDAALAGSGSMALVGKPGIGKSEALVQLALTQPEWPVVIIKAGFNSDNLNGLLVRAQFERGVSEKLCKWQT